MTRSPPAKRRKFNDTYSLPSLTVNENHDEHTLKQLKDTIRRYDMALDERLREKAAPAYIEAWFQASFPTEGERNDYAPVEGYMRKQLDPSLLAIMQHYEHGGIRTLTTRWLRAHNIRLVVKDKDRVWESFWENTETGDRTVPLYTSLYALFSVAWSPQMERNMLAAFESCSDGEVDAKWRHLLFIKLHERALYKMALSLTDSHPFVTRTALVHL